MKKIIFCLTLIMFSLSAFGQNVEKPTVYMGSVSVMIDTAAYAITYENTGHSMFIIYLMDSSNNYAFMGIFDTEGDVFDNNGIDSTFQCEKVIYGGCISDYKRNERCDVQSGTVQIIYNKALTYIKAELECDNMKYVFESGK